MTFEPVLAKQRVLLTGHTGFTGGWLALWLRAIGCDVTGLALPPESRAEPVFLRPHRRPIEIQARRHPRFLRRYGKRWRRRSRTSFSTSPRSRWCRAGSRTPLETFATNVIGTAHVLEAARLAAGRQGGGVRHHRQGLCRSRAATKAIAKAIGSGGGIPMRPPRRRPSWWRRATATPWRSAATRC